MNKTIQENIEVIKKLVPGGALIQLTDVMLEKQFIYSEEQVKDFLIRFSIFDLEELGKGEAETVNCQLFYDGSLFERQVTLSHGQEGSGIWIYNLNKNTQAGDWVYLTSKDDIFFVIPINEKSDFKIKAEKYFDGQLNYVVSSGLKNLIGKQLI